MVTTVVIQVSGKQARQDHTRTAEHLFISYVCYLHSNKHVTVKYIAAHTGNTLKAAELRFLPLPQSTKDTVSFKLLQGVPTKRILQGNDTNEQNCDNQWFSET